MMQVPTVHQCLNPLADHIAALERRIAALESRPCCNASHAPSSDSATVSPTSSVTSSDGCATGSLPTPISDAARRALADPDRPKWLTREMCEGLPEGVTEVWNDGHRRCAEAYPGEHIYTNRGGWENCASPHDYWGTKPNHKVYHIPPAAKDEGDAWSRFADQFGYRKDMVSKALLAGAAWIDGDQFNAFVAAECERAVSTRNAELLRVRTTQHGAAHELDNIAVECGLGHSPKPGAVAEYVRSIRHSSTPAGAEAVTDPYELARIMATPAFRKAVADAIRHERNAP